MNKAQKYVIEQLPNELKEVQQNIPATEAPELTEYEKTLIYKYTEDGYAVNLLIKEGRVGEFAGLLSKALRKLPDHKGLVYRGAILDATTKEELKNAFRNGKPWSYVAFMSASKRISPAYMWATQGINGCLLNIVSNKGKDIEGISKYGRNTSQNEFEVLFDRNCKFTILSMREESGLTIITMEQL